MQIWPFTPLANIVETLAWHTNVLQSRTSEDALSLRVPRQGFTYRFSFDDRQMAIAEGLYRSNPTGDWLVPVWPERTLVSNIATADTSLVVNTAADYRIGGRAVIIYGQDLVQEITTVAVGVASIDLSAPVGENIAQSAVAPLRVAYCATGLKVDRQFQGRTIVTMGFQVRDNLEIPETPYVQYLGLDVLTDPSLTVRPLSGNIVMPTTLIDNGFGPVVIENIRDVMRGRHAAEFLDATPEARWRRKKWLFYLNGRQRHFWLPTWADDLVLTGPVSAVSNSITVNPILPNVADYVGRHIMVEGDPAIYREVTSAVVSGLNHRLYLSPLGVDIPEGRVGFLNKVRMDADTVEINHEATMRSRTGLQLMEV
ncbi:MAG: hypothetical protein COA84_15090 [Robiginitomaculum sp.]|nr:MAG: hypothetical protein COA84_15090 [Robiginitomaculum sp.]